VDQKERTNTNTRNQSVETNAKIAPDQVPYFEGQTRIKSVETTTTYTIDTVAAGLNRIWGLAFLPDEKILITEKPGRMRIIDTNGFIGDTIAGLPPSHFQQDGGLMDVVLAPDFAQSREIFWSYTEKRDTGYVPAIARAKLVTDNGSLEEVQVIYRAMPAIGSVMHYGAKLLFDPTGHLLATIGERYEDRVRIRAQTLDSAFGKIIRIDRNGNPAPNNPFRTNGDTIGEIWALGFRDPEGLAFHPSTGQLWCSDHGPRGGDEINIVIPGENYGWPMISYGMDNSGKPVNGGLTQLPGMQQPRYYWDPAVAPAGISFYSGQLIPEWRNNLLVACLRGKHISRLIIEGDQVVGEERLLTKYDNRFRGVAEGPEGALYAWTDEEEATILRIKN